MEAASLQVAQIVPDTQAEGPGRRFAIWLQGCPLRCPGCCNPEMLPFAGGQEMAVTTLLEQIERPRGIEGITLLGGEPFAQAESAAVLARGVRDLDLSVMVFTGFTLAELRQSLQPGIPALLAMTDLLVDGPYLRDQPETRRRWIGSTNQQIHFLTGRYSPDDDRWHLPNTLELRLENGTLTINGFPARQADRTWKRIGKLGGR